MSKHAIILTLCAILSGITSAELLKNITIQVPNSTTYSEDDGVICLPPAWYDYFIFIFGNYIAHAATVKSYPGERLQYTLIVMASALLFPSCGIRRALDAIFRHARWEIHGFKIRKPPSELMQAARAGALCMVVRSDKWKPWAGDTIGNASQKNERPLPFETNLRASVSRKHSEIKIVPLTDVVVAAKSSSTKLPVGQSAMPSHKYDNPDTSIDECHRRSIDVSETAASHIDASHTRKIRRFTVKINSPDYSKEYLRIWLFGDTANVIVENEREIHGAFSLTDEYRFHYVPRDAIVGYLPGCDGQSQRTAFSSSWSGPQSLIAIVQTIFGATTLYRTRGSQLDQYGYAAFGLTVAPYVVMSIVNLLAHFLTPDYQSLYLVGSDILEEAKLRGCSFEGVVGNLSKINHDDDSSFASGTFALDPCNTSTGRTAGASLLFEPFSRGRGDSVDESHSDPQIQSVQEIELNIASCSPFKRLKNDLIPAFDLDKFTDGTTCSQFIIIIISAFSLIVIGSISRFHAGHSTLAQRVWTMFWLALGIMIGPTMHGMDIDRRIHMAPPRSVSNTFASQMSQLGLLIVYSAPAIGGFVVVMQMISAFGICTNLT